MSLVSKRERYVHADSGGRRGRTNETAALCAPVLQSFGALVDRPGRWRREALTVLGGSEKSWMKSELEPMAVTMDPLAVSPVAGGKPSCDARR